jgi:hypothetical protein
MEMKTFETLSVYFLGTSFDAVDALNTREIRGYKELLTQLYLLNNADYYELNTLDPNRSRKNINELKKNSQNSILTKKYNPKSVHIKILVKGIGSNTKEITNGNISQPSFLNKIKKVTGTSGFSISDKLKQAFGIGFSSRVSRTVEAVQNIIAENGGNNCNIKKLNLFGFSRGGITAILVANELANIINIESIQIFALDPVFGKRKTFKLVDSDKIKSFVGVYAAKEQSTFFDASIPFTSKSFLESNKCYAFFLPCLHETLIGNIHQFNARSLSEPLLKTNELKIIFDFVLKLSLLFSNLWGVPYQTVHESKYELELLKLSNMILEICHDEVLYSKIKKIAPFSQFVPNPFGVIDKKYIFSDGHHLNIKQILNKNFFNLPKSNQSIDKENLIFLMKSINIEILNKIKNNILKNNLHQKIKIPNYF